MGSLTSQASYMICQKKLLGNLYLMVYASNPTRYVPRLLISARSKTQVKKLVKSKVKLVFYS